ncbi:MAG TPA: 16S rRNA (cytidine(1402)-2'-O)-methyltransferase [Bryobacteraceae bacterium]
MSGTLYLVSTPIGNLEDITLRALRILRDEVTTVACEDTRQTRKLLDHYEIAKPLLSYHEHNEASRTAEMLELLRRGEWIALACDSGTPLISDPGYRVVTAAIGEGIAVVPLPGASAVMAALAASGLPTDEFRFLGFLPSKAGARRRALEGILQETATVITYESPHRILDTLDDIAEVLGEQRPVTVARELTKLHEEFLRGSARKIYEELSSRPAVKGEITLVIGKGERVENKPGDPQAEVLRLQTEGGLSRMDAIKAVAKQMGLPKREAYRLFAAEGSNPPGKRRDSD